MKRIILSMLMVGLFLTASYYASAQKAIKIGIVDVETIVKEIPEATEAEQSLQKMAQTYRDSLLSIEKIFTERMAQYNKQKSVMNAEQQKKEEAALQQLQLDYQQYQQEKLGTQGELAQTREQLLAPIRERVRDAIKKVAKKEGMNFILDKANQFLLYSEDEFDITFLVLDQIKRGNKK
jgi:outer membrane protein